MDIHHDARVMVCTANLVTALSRCRPLNVRKEMLQSAGLVRSTRGDMQVA